IQGLSAVSSKSCDEMEGPYLDYIRQLYCKPVLLTGPLVPDPPKYKLEEKWEKWLQKFPSKSVVFCSFGSETFLKDDQIKELVLGLEQTGLPFIVVLNFPPGDGDSNEKLKNALPVGFAERVQGKGVVHTGWLQQQLILAHDSVGSYVCRSGLSSVIEAFMTDCQLVTLPQKGDQFLNSKLISGDLEAGVQVTRDDEDGHFNKEDLCKATKIVTVDVNEEPGKSISVNHGKWRDFLLNKDIQDNFIANLVQEMKKMVN
ncbi:anthocyanidin 3-O-glucosyltransferase-like, partial [Papaver somniferum]|uniref:anthocyanidin 3-O-glucosyltransferase-like n=1 Tax=Papaver somniferum TaxID=3469 RepID=UPI000E6FF251